MGYLVYIFIFMMLSRVLMYSPIFGILIYGFLFYSIYSSMKKRRGAQQYYQQQANQHESAREETSSQKQSQKTPNDADVIDVEYTQEDVQ